MNRIKLYKGLSKISEHHLKGTLYLFFLTLGVFLGFLLSGLNFEYTLVSTVLVAAPIISFCIGVNGSYFSSFLALFIFSILLSFVQFMFIGIPYELLNMRDFENVDTLILFVAYFVDLGSLMLINKINETKKSNTFQRFFEFKSLFLDVSSFYQKNEKKSFLSEKTIKVLYDEKPNITKNYILNKEVVVLLEDDDLVKISHLSESYKNLDKSGLNYKSSKNKIDSLYKDYCSTLYFRKKEAKELGAVVDHGSLTNDEIVKETEAIMRR